MQQNQQAQNQRRRNPIDINTIPIDYSKPSFKIKDFTKKQLEAVNQAHDSFKTALRVNKDIFHEVSPEDKLLIDQSKEFLNVLKPMWSKLEKMCNLPLYEDEFEFM